MKDDLMTYKEEQLTKWKVWFEERKEKRLTIKEFCKEKEISPGQFYYYHDLLYKPEKRHKKEKDQVSKIKPIQIVNSAPKENMTIRFILPNNLQCMLPRDMTSQEIKTILELMMSCF
jgi:hypothetical protein